MIKGNLKSYRDETSISMAEWDSISLIKEDSIFSRS